MGRLIDADKYMEYLRAEINTEADIIAKYIKEDDPIGTVKDCGRIGRLQGLQWNRNMLELDRFIVEAIPKDQYEARLKADMVDILETLLSGIKERTFLVTNPFNTYEDIAVISVELLEKTFQEKINALRGTNE